MLTASWVVTMVVLGAALVRDDMGLTLAGIGLALAAFAAVGATRGRADVD